ncbi:MAG: J domain-containing protein [Verrucomicrobiae bacterium]|nr:J domain-containing protein [Verrucomicrobiae bacterium]NNJ42643.1 hypothetical protein [Akkermansiaceae bacterium]
MLAGDLIRGVVYYFGKGDGVMGRFGNFIELSTQRGSLVRELDQYAMDTGLRPDTMKVYIMLLGVLWIYVTAAVLGIFGIEIDPPYQTFCSILLAIGLGCIIEQGKVKYVKKADREIKQRLTDSEKEFINLSQVFGDLSGAYYNTGQEIKGYKATGLLSGTIYENRLKRVHDNFNLLDNGFRYGMWNALNGAFSSIEDTLKTIREDAKEEVEKTVIEQAIETEEGAHDILETGVDILRDSVKAKKERAKKQFKKMAKLYHEDSHPNATQDEIDELNKKFNIISRAHNHLKSIY